MSKSSVKLGSNDRSIVINRTSTSIPHSRLSMGGIGGMGGGSMSMSSRMSMGGSVRLQPGSASSVTSEQIQGVKDRNQMEKKAFQECNMKLAKKVEKEKFLQSQNQILLQELNILRGKKNLDRTDIEKQCIDELEAYRLRLEGVNEETAKTSAKIANLNDQVEDVNRMNNTLEGDIAARIKQIERLNTQLGDMEGENATLRRTIGTHEDEIKRLKLCIEDYKQNLDDARCNLEDECRQRIAIELDSNVTNDHKDFTVNVLESEIVELKKLMNTDVGQLDIKNLWKGEITKCIKQLQEDNEKELDKIKAEYQSRYDSQLRQMNAAQMKENANQVKLESEISRLKTKHVDQGPLIAELNAKLQTLKCENDGLLDQIADLQEKLDYERSEHASDCDSYQMQLNDLMERFRELQDVKMTLETEISTYRRLLEGEEDSMDRFVTNSSGARSPGADKLNDLVQSSSS